MRHVRIYLVEVRRVGEVVLCVDYVEPKTLLLHELLSNFLVLVLVRRNALELARAGPIPYGDLHHLNQTLYGSARERSLLVVRFV